MELAFCAGAAPRPSSHTASWAWDEEWSRHTPGEQKFVHVVSQDHAGESSSPVSVLLYIKACQHQCWVCSPVLHGRAFGHANIANDSKLARAQVPRSCPVAAPGAGEMRVPASGINRLGIVHHVTL